MLIRELPDKEQQKLLALLPPDIAWETIANLTVEELPLFFHARLEDLDRRHLLLQEIYDLAQFVSKQYSGKKLEYSLDREAWYRFASRPEPLPISHYIKAEIREQLEQCDRIHVDSVVNGALRRMPFRCPESWVREHMEYILETLAELG